MRNWPILENQRVFLAGLVFCLALLSGCIDPESKTDLVVIRVNNLGYNIGDSKIAVIGSNLDLLGQSCSIFRTGDLETPVFSAPITEDRGAEETPFQHNFAFDFSEFREPGEYRLELSTGEVSPPFAIGAEKEYRQALSAVLDFFRSQRCGDTGPILHQPCHLNDAKAAIDASGGWHDAGDYIKYMMTVTVASLELLTAADYAQSYGFHEAMGDRTPGDGIPDLIEESRIGLEWILKMTSDYENGNYYYQVSGAEDHDFWRLPESDDQTHATGNPRTLHSGWGGNLLGRSAAALAIASRVFRDYDSEFAQKCLERAEGLFAEHENYQVSQPAMPAEFYNEREWRDDMVLGAAELFLTTQKPEYRRYAESHLEMLTGDDIGWNGMDYLAFASSYRAGILAELCKEKMLNILVAKKERSDNQPYFLSSGYAWGTTALFTADAQKALMYFYLTNDDSFNEMATAQRDYLLGRNSWGVSFIVGLGPVYPERVHSQLNDLAGLHRGAAVGGPAKRDHWQETMTNEYAFPDGSVESDRFEKFQCEIVYFDDQKDYYTNEVAIDYAAPSVFLLLHNIAEAAEGRQ